MEENEGCQEMKTLGASEKELLSVLRAQLLSVLQFATPAWSDPITQKESAQIKSLLKTGLYLVYGQKYKTFLCAFKQANMSSLSEERQKMFHKFTKRLHQKHQVQEMFCNV